jgi:integrase
VFIVLYRTGGAGSKLRKYTIGPYGRVTLHQARIAAQKVFAAKLEGRDPAAEKRERKRRVVADRVEDLLETYVEQRLSQNRSGAEIARLLRRETGKAWAGRSIREIGKRDVVEVISAIEQRGAPVAANKALKSIKTFLRWCVGRAVLDQSPAEGVPLPAKEVPRDRGRATTSLPRSFSPPYGSMIAMAPLLSWLGTSWISRNEFGRSLNHEQRTYRAAFGSIYNCPEADDEAEPLRVCYP